MKTLLWAATNCRVDRVKGADFTPPMRVLAVLLLFGGFATCGCARHKAGVLASGGTSGSGAFAESVAVQRNQKLIVTPENGLVGKVASINTVARFVVLNFPIGHLPAMDQRFNVYRLGLKIGEVKVTGPQLEDNVVADLLTGDAQVGDEVRDK